MCCWSVHLLVTFGLFPPLATVNKFFSEHWCTSTCLSSCSQFFSVCLFVHVFEKERECKCRRGIKGERERILSRLHTQHRAQCSALSHGCEIMTWAKIKSQMFHRLSHKVPPIFLFSIPRNGMLHHLVILCLAVWGATKLFSTANAPFHIFTSHVQEFVYWRVTLKVPGILPPPQTLWDKFYYKLLQFISPGATAPPGVPLTGTSFSLSQALHHPTFTHSLSEVSHPPQTWV